MRRVFVVTVVVLLAPTCKIRLPAAESGEEGQFPCEAADQCPAPPQACLLTACWEGQCVYVPAPEGSLPPEAQIAGDCAELYCDGQGNIVTGLAPRDIPADDGNACTNAICDVGIAKQAPKMAGTHCGRNGVCNGAGRCGVCLPTALRCEDNALSTCTPEGAWDKPVACSEATPRCHRNACVGVAEIGAGAAHACARFSDGSVLCWGAGAEALPTRNAAPFTALALGPRHGCGIAADGAVFCWGAGEWGQLGQGRHSSSETPVAVGIHAHRIAVGSDHSCALARDGQVLCWGRNDRGQLGSGKLPPRPEPPSAIVPPREGAPPAPIVDEGASALSLSGSATCLRAAGGTTVCTQLPAYPPGEDLEADGADPATPRLLARRRISAASPRPLGFSAGALGCGADHCCALSLEGAVRCWGAGDRNQLGVGLVDSPRPLSLPGMTGSRLAVGADFACVLGAELQCWGENQHGQLGRGSDSANGAPGPVALSGPAREVVAGDRFACALLASGSLECWGDGSAGQLARSEPKARAPLPVAW